ncbi:hypothetical protein ACQBAR_17290 [Propionibacteriaceae bacterium Y1685]
MSTGLRVAGFLVALGVIFGGGWLLGDALPVSDPTPTSSETPDGGGHGHQETPEGSGEDGGGHDHGEAPDGTTSQVDGHALVITTPEVAPGRTKITFVISGPDGTPVTEFDTLHEKQLHLIAVREDLSGFNHVHPQRDTDGIWSTELDLTPGHWRIYADFQPSGHDQLTLGAALHVTGTEDEVPLPTPATTTEVDGYTVTLDTEAKEGEHPIAFTVRRDGQDVTDLEPYLGAYGHIVILRSYDLAYLHAHPTSTVAGPLIEAHASYPTNGSYRAYLEFKHEGQLHRAEFTIEVP